MHKENKNNFIQQFILFCVSHNFFAQEKKILNGAHSNDWGGVDIKLMHEKNFFVCLKQSVLYKALSYIQ